MTSLTISDLYGAVRGRGNPLVQPAGHDDDPEGIKVSISEPEGWYEKTVQYRHSCMVNVADINRQLTDGKFLSNKRLLEARKAFLLSEINVCHRMLSMFAKEMN